MGSNELGVPGLRARHASQTHREQDTNGRQTEQQSKQAHAKSERRQRSNGCIASGGKNHSSTNKTNKTGIGSMFRPRRTNKAERSKQKHRSRSGMLGRSTNGHIGKQRRKQNHTGRRQEQTQGKGGWDTKTGSVRVHARKRVEPCWLGTLG